jgi:hypothetical protein
MKKKVSIIVTTFALFLNVFTMSIPNASASTLATVSNNTTLIIQLEALLKQLIAQLAVLQASKSATPHLSTNTCTLRTDKASYLLGDTVTFSWNAPGAKFVLFAHDNGFKDGLDLPEGIFETTTGTASTKTNFIGTDEITLEVHNAYGAAPIATCKAEVNVDEVKRSFSLGDVRSIVRKIVHPIPSKPDQDYEEYAITLKSGDSFNMDIFQVQYADRGMIFEANGYTGNSDALMAMVR